jgi:hypothetical protein
MHCLSKNRNFQVISIISYQNERLSTNKKKCYTSYQDVWLRMGFFFYFVGEPLFVESKNWNKEISMNK